MAITPKPPGTIGAPNDLTEQPAGTVSAPNTIPVETAGAVVAPNTIPAQTPGTVAIPNTLTSETPGAIAIPNTLNSEAAGTVAAPNVIPQVAPAGLPRSLTPLVDLNFAQNSFSQAGNPKSLLDIATYARPSSATFINRRINALGEFEFFLDEDFVGTVTNLLTFSEQFDNAIWSKTGVSINANSEVSPIGTRTADKLVGNGVSTTYFATQAFTATSGVTYTFSYHVKVSELSQIRISFSSVEFTAREAIIDIPSRSVLAQDSGVVVAIIDEGNGWVNCSITSTAVATGSNGVSVQLIKNGGATFTATNEGLFIWGAQLTVSSKPQPYVKTISSTAMQTFTENLRIEYDAATGENLGALIEGGITNLALRSEEFDNASWGKTRASISANATKAPDDTVSADKLVENTDNDTHDISIGGLGSAGDHTLSVFAKASERSFVALRMEGFNTFFDLSNGSIGTNGSGNTPSIENAGDGWFRCSITRTLSGVTSIVIRLADADNSDSYLGDGTSGLFIWGAQLEALPFASSYIRTEGSTVARSADDLSVTSGFAPTSGDFTSHALVNITDLPTGGSGDFRYIYRVNTATPFSSIRIRDAGELESVHGSASPDLAPDGGFNNNFSASLVFNSGSNIINGFLDGLNTVNLDAGTVFSIESGQPLNIGVNAAGSQYLFGHIAEFKTYNKSLTAQEVSLL